MQENKNKILSNNLINLKKRFKRLRMICKNYILKKIKLEKIISKLNLNLKLKEMKFTIQNGLLRKSKRFLIRKKENKRESRQESKLSSIDPTHIKKKLISPSI